MTIGERIKDRRIALNLTQDELAQKVGYKSRSSIQKIESARDLPLNKIEAMATALDCTPGYLMGWSDDLEQFATFKPVVSPDKAKHIVQVLEKEDEEESLSDLDIIIEHTQNLNSDMLKRVNAYINALIQLREK